MRNRSLSSFSARWMVWVLMLGCATGSTGVEDASHASEDGGSSSSEDASASRPDGGLPGTDAGGSPADAATPCTPFEDGMTVTADTWICPGTYTVSADPGISIGADGVTLDAEGVVLEGTGFEGTGLSIEGVSDVTVTGLSARGFRYGLVARDASNIAVRETDFDDNFTDPEAEWVQDQVQGGGIRFERVVGGEVAMSRFARNWNGVELRETRNVTVRDNIADHCSNWAALLVDAHDNEVLQNDFSWAVRGGESGPLSYPDRWYAVDTKDAAGIVLDAGSSGNRIAGNDCTYGGDGIFLRAVIGGCATGNVIEDNDTSFSPHNAIESWCDDNVFENNVASHSHFGIWLGGSDRAVVRGNIVERNLEDGISIQIAEDRHTIIENNRIAFNGYPQIASGGPLPVGAYTAGYLRGVGILLTGRQYQSWHRLDHWHGEVANSSHLLLQNNRFEGNRGDDIFATATRALLSISNCTDGDVLPTVGGGRDNGLITVAGTCSSTTSASPTASLSVPSVVTEGVEVVLDATASTSASGQPLTYLWLVQEGGTRYDPPVMPEPVLIAEGASTEALTFDAPGAYEVDVTVHDGVRGAMAWQQVLVQPSGATDVVTDASEWTSACSATHDSPATLASPGSCTTVLSPTSVLSALGVDAETDADFDFLVAYPASQDLDLDLSAADTRLGFFLRGENLNERGGWQGAQPTIVLGTAGGGTRTYTPTGIRVSSDGAEWRFVDLALDGSDPDWELTNHGGSLADVDWIEIHFDTWGGRPYRVEVDRLVRFQHTPPSGGPCASTLNRCYLDAEGRPTDSTTSTCAFSGRYGIDSAGGCWRCGRRTGYGEFIAADWYGGQLGAVCTAPADPIRCDNECYLDGTGKPTATPTDTCASNGDYAADGSACWRCNTDTALGTSARAGWRGGSPAASCDATVEPATVGCSNGCYVTADGRAIDSVTSTCAVTGAYGWGQLSVGCWRCATSTNAGSIVAAGWHGGSATPFCGEALE